MIPEVVAAKTRAKARADRANQGRVTTLANALDSSWGRLVEKLGGLGVLAFLLWMVFANYLPAQQRTQEASMRSAQELNSTQAKAFTDAMSAFSKAMSDEGDANRRAIGDLADAIRSLKNSGSGAR